MKFSQTELVARVRKSGFLSRLIGSFSRARSQRIVELCAPHLSPGARLLDIGCGIGHTAEEFAAKKFAVIACDIVDLRFVPLAFVLADGAHLPFDRETFDGALLITVLHHAPAAQHLAILREAARVLRPNGRLIILEDTYRTRFERRLTHVLDSLMNLEFFNHPHANRSLREWRALIKEANLQITCEHEFTAWYGLARMRHALIIAEFGAF
jgi:SAM-dependent methyltransferase